MADETTNSTLDNMGAERTRQWVLFALVAGLVVYAYAILKTCVVGITPVSLLNWLLAYWSRGGDYAHGYVVPVVAAGIFFWKWRTVLHALPPVVTTSGLVGVVVAVLAFYVGVKAQNPRAVAGSLVIMTFGLVHYFGGWQWAKQLWFPCVFLLFMIPVTFLEQPLAFPLRMFVAKLSVWILNVLGLDVLQDGTAIRSAQGRFQPLDVANPCSGIRSLVALMALTSLYGYVTMDRGWKKWILFLSSIPLAVLGNLARISTVALVAQGFGQDIAMKVYHEYSGYIVFSLAILCMLALGAALNLHYRDWIHHWMQEEEIPQPVAPTRRPTKTRR
jgi:exosortase